MKMLFYIMVSIACLFMAACRPAPHQSAPSTKVETDTVQVPDIMQLRKNLWDFFAAHKDEDSFSMTDDRYRQYGGVVNYPPYRVTAGHLLHSRQVHALIFYSDENGSGLFVYKKDQTGWTNILTDTTLRVNAAGANIRLQDWNKDGVNDIDFCYPSPVGSISVIDRYDLWLADEQGDELQAINGFDTIENPEPDTVTGNILSTYYYHGAHEKAYRFRGHQLQPLYQIKPADVMDDREGQVVLVLYNEAGKPGAQRRMTADKATQQARNHVRALRTRQ